MPRPRGKGATVTLGIAAAALIVALVLTLQRQTSPRVIAASHSQPDLSVRRHIGPTLRELRANFAVLRRPATASEHAAVATFTAATSDQPEIPEYVRLADVINGMKVYFVVYPIFRHGARGAVVAHQMNLAGGDTGLAWGPGNYLIFPAALSGSDGSTYLSVVPDGVRSVTWRFACPPNSSSGPCQLPPEHVVHVPVHDNLAVWQTNTHVSWSPYGNVATVTWFGADGLTKVFTNANAAVPFPGAPARVG